MKTGADIDWLNFGQMASVAGFVIAVATIWIHLEVSIAEINVDLTNLKQDVIMHKTENRNDLETLRDDMKSNTREILLKVDEIQIYLRNKNGEMAK